MKNNKTNPTAIAGLLRLSKLAGCALALAAGLFAYTSAAQQYVTVEVTPGAANTIYEYDNSSWETAGTVSSFTIRRWQEAYEATPATDGDLEVGFHFTSGTYYEDPDCDFEVSGADETPIWHVTIPSGSSSVIVSVHAIDNPDKSGDFGNIELVLYSNPPYYGYALSKSSADIAEDDGDDSP